MISTATRTQRCRLVQGLVMLTSNNTHYVIHESKSLALLQPSIRSQEKLSGRGLFPSWRSFLVVTAWTTGLRVID